MLGYHNKHCLWLPLFVLAAIMSDGKTLGLVIPARPHQLGSFAFSHARAKSVLKSPLLDVLLRSTASLHTHLLFRLSLALLVALKLSDYNLGIGSIVMFHTE